jgi:Clp amino terminal domain, pathogenicity island component
MMLERFTSDARAVVVGAREAAAGLGHNFIGCEHLLLALAGDEGEVGLALRDQGVTQPRVRAETLRLVGPGRGISLFDVLDRDALASIGIDLDAIRGKVEQAFGPDALVAPPGRRPRGRRWRRRRGAAAAAAPDEQGQVPDAGGGRIPFTPGAKKALMHAVREARAEHSGQIGTEHLGLAVVSMTDGAVPPILAAIGASGPHLRSAILSRFRQAS